MRILRSNYVVATAVCKAVVEIRLIRTLHQLYQFLDVVEELRKTLLRLVRIDVKLRQEFI